MIKQDAKTRIIFPRHITCLMKICLVVVHTCIDILKFFMTGFHMFVDIHEY